MPKKRAEIESGCVKFTIRDLLKYSFCITTGHDEYERFKYRFIERGFPEDMVPRKYNGLIAKHLRNGKTPMQLCGLSHYNLINFAQTMDFPWITIFEDDALGQFGCYDKLSRCLEGGVPKNADLIMWGNLNFIQHPDRLLHDINISRFGMPKLYLFGAHAYTVFRKFYVKYINTILRCEGEINPDWFHEFDANIYATKMSYFIQCKDRFQHKEELVDDDRNIESLKLFFK